jgi:type IV fimbrial biogenesis protein FimT
VQNLQAGLQSPVRHASGFTAVELLVTLALVAILAALASPSLVRLVQNSRISSAVNTLLADVRFARSEAARRATNVVLCRSDAPEAPSPRCATSMNGPDGNGWISGWIVFVDADDNKQFGTGDTLLRVRSRVQGVDSMTQATGSTWKLSYTAAGRFRNISSGTLSMQVGASVAPEVQRVLCIDSLGRPRVAGDGNASCS